MQGKIVSARLRATLAVFTMTVFVTTACAATEKVLHNFGSSGKDGHKPLASLIFDASGNLYGTTSEGGSGIEHCNTGTGGCGTVFELTPKGGGRWTEKVLHSFKADGKDGYYPSGGLVFDASGNLYGTTYGGGVHGGGTVFELTPGAGGNWTERLLHSFNNDANGWAPGSTLTLDAAGSLYGTTIFGGVLSCGYGGTGCGTVFELTSKAGEGWTEKVLRRFNGKDGESPSTSVVFDASGSLYGTAALGGDLTCGKGYGCGTVFKLTPKVGGRWAESVLHKFNANGKDGTYPDAGLVVDASGNLYSTTYEGGALSCYYGYGCGTVFELTPTAGGGWTEKILHTFNNNGRNGSGPVATLIFDASGNPYGTTIRGGNQSCGNSDGCGTVFEITP